MTPQKKEELITELLVERQYYEDLGDEETVQRIDRLIEMLQTEDGIRVGPSGTTKILKNGLYDISLYSNAYIHVPSTGELQSKTITPTKNTQYITPDEDYDALSDVTVNKIPDEYVIPEGSITVTENSTVDVTNYVSAVVNVPEREIKLQNKVISPTKSQQSVVYDQGFDGLAKVDVAPIPSSYIIPAGSYNANANGTYDITNYASVQVNVPDREIRTQNKTATPTKDTQHVTPDSGYDGLLDVTVNPIPSNYIIPSGNYSITENGNYTIKQYNTVSVNVEGGGSGENLDAEITEQEGTIDDIQDLLSNLPSGELQEKTVTPTMETQNITADSGYYGLSKVTVSPIPYTVSYDSTSKTLTINT